MYLVYDKSKQNAVIAIFRKRKNASKYIHSWQDEYAQNLRFVQKRMYSTEIFFDNIHDWLVRRNERKYNKLVTKRNRLDRKIRNFKRVQ